MTDVMRFLGACLLVAALVVLASHGIARFLPCERHLEYPKPIIVREHHTEKIYYYNCYYMDRRGWAEFRQVPCVPPQGPTETLSQPSPKIEVPWEASPISKYDAEPLFDEEHGEKLPIPKGAESAK